MKVLAWAYAFAVSFVVVYILFCYLVPTGWYVRLRRGFSAFWLSRSVDFGGLLIIALMFAVLWVGLVISCA